MTTNEHDPFDDWPELQQLRELHQNDRMPTNVRERLLRRGELTRAPARSLVGSADVASALPAASSRASEALRWDEPTRIATHHPLRALLGIAGASLAAAAAFVLWFGMPSEHISVESEHPAPRELAARPYTKGELQALGVEPGATEVRVVGRLVPGSLTRLPPLPPHHRIRCGYHFHLRPPGVSTGDGIHVEYARCRAPEQLIDDGASCVEVSATGLLRADGHLDASRIVPEISGPCPQPN